ncbi:MAG TPA: glucokinase [Pyrinomonadaceae bacterium]|nr:glucokinase [Pyrinomonadaceae bacterium]
MIIAGDIGGTKTNIALFEPHGQRLDRIIAQRSYPSGKYSSLGEIVGEFVAELSPRVTHACFGVAGPVAHGRVEATNLPWVVSAESLASRLGLARVGLINDLEATAYGVEVLQPAQFYTLNPGAGAGPGHRALIAAGTGLGMAGIFWDGERYHPISSEGGHMDFAPRNEREIELFLYVREKIGGRVSVERALSGPGLVTIYTFLRDRGHGEEPAWLADELRGGDPAAAISRAGLARKSELAAEALDMFVEIYGAMAGNLALLLRPSGGLYVGGGIAPKIIEKLKGGAFMRAYLDKGRMSGIVEETRVCVILDDKAALYGAGRAALLHAGE